MRGFRALIGVALAFTYVLIVLGAVVRSTDSGLACPDWPRCYGLWLPTPGKLAALPDVGHAYYQIMLEWTHRLIAGVIVAPLAVAACVWALAVRRAAPGLVPASALALALVVIQAGLGGLTVLEGNSPWSVAVHLGAALLFFAVLVLVFLLAQRRLRPPGAPERPGPALHAGTGLAALAALATIASGAMVAKAGASLACTGWPLCEGAALPALDDPFVRLHFSHRLLALGTVLLIGGLFVLARARRARAPRFHHEVSGAAALALVAVALGAVVVVHGLPLAAAVVHQAVGVLVFAALVASFWRALAQRPGRAHA